MMSRIVLFPIAHVLTFAMSLIDRMLGTEIPRLLEQGASETTTPEAV